MIDARKFINNRRLDRKSGWSVLLLSGLLLAAWPSGAHAQINPFRGYKGPPLSKEDLDSANTAAAQLLAKDEAQVGKSERWSGQNSGDEGSITVQKAFKRQGMECRTLRSEFRYKKTPGRPRIINLDVCRLQTGEWKMM